MCELGRKDAEKNGICRDPHVFSNMSPTRFMVVGQNPGWDELREREPFVGAAGRNFNNEIAKNGHSRSDFYITNTVKCWTRGNSKPRGCHISACEPFLRMEVNLLKPDIIVALGAVAFQTLCPNDVFSECLRKITISTYGKVYAIYHPSPMNINNQERRVKFNSQIGLLCAAMDRLNKNNGK
jgi:DNA polymerase